MWGLEVVGGAAYEGAEVADLFGGAVGGVVVGFCLLVYEGRMPSLRLALALMIGEVEEVVGGVSVDGLLVEGVDVGAAAGAGEVGVEDDDVAG